jgi:hypothetical protein
LLLKWKEKGGRRKRERGVIRGEWTGTRDGSVVLEERTEERKEEI